MSRLRAPAAVAGALAALALLTAACGGSGRSGAPGDGSVATTAPGPTSATGVPDTSGVTPTIPTSPPSTAPGRTTLTGAPPTTAPPAGGPAVQIRRGNPGRMMVALTFDAGSDVGSTDAILDTLAARGIRATFGMTGAWAERYPDEVRRMVAGGHQLLNHSYDHPSFTGYSTGKPALTSAQRADQLARTEAVLGRLGASARPWFRPPYGDVDASVDADIGAAGYRYDVLWTVDSLGWQGIPAGQIVSRCIDGAVPGAILLLHVGSASADGEALPAIIDGLQARGYGFATVAGIVG